MYETNCSNPKCTKGEGGGRAVVKTYAINRAGHLPASYCSSFCEKEAGYDKRFVKWTKR